MMAVMPQEDSEEHLDELDIIDDFLKSLTDPDDQESLDDHRVPRDQSTSDPGPERPGWAVSPRTYAVDT